MSIVIEENRYIAIGLVGDVLICSVYRKQKPTEKQLQEVVEAQNKPIVFDEDSPELSPAMCKVFKCSVMQKNRKKNA